MDARLIHAREQRDQLLFLALVLQRVVPSQHPDDRVEGHRLRGAVHEVLHAAISTGELSAEAEALAGQGLLQIKHCEVYFVALKIPIQWRLVALVGNLALASFARHQHALLDLGVQRSAVAQQRREHTGDGKLRLSKQHADSALRLVLDEHRRGLVDQLLHLLDGRVGQHHDGVVESALCHEHAHDLVVVTHYLRVEQHQRLVVARVDEGQGSGDVQCRSAQNNQIQLNQYTCKLVKFMQNLTCWSAGSS